MPSAYKGYLVAKVLRSERAVNTDQLWHDVGVPSLIGKSKSMNNSPSLERLIYFETGMTVVILLTIICAWEGYCCRKFIESNDCFICGCCSVNLS